MNHGRGIPHIQIVIASCVVAVAGYAFFSVYAIIWLRDATMTGDIIGTWKSFAVAAFAFWLGSSSGGKEKPDVTGTKENPTITEGASNKPQDVNVVNPPHEPVPTTTTGETAEERA